MSDTTPLEFKDLLSIIPGSVSLGVAALTCSLILYDLRGPHTERKRRYNVWLLAFVGALALQSLVDILEGLGFFNRHLRISGMDYVHWPLLPVALREYISALTCVSAAQQKTRSLLRRYWSVPVAWIALGTFVVLPPRIKLTFFDEADVMQMPTQDQLAVAIGALGYGIFWVIWMALLIWAGWSIQSMLRRHDRWLKTNYSNIDGIDLSWIKQMLLICLAAVFVAVTDQVLTILGAPSLPEWMFSVFVMGLALGFGFLGIAKDEQLLRTATLAQPHKAERNAAPPANEMAAPKPYARSSMSEDDGRRIADRLDQLMHSDQLWKNSSLSLRNLADASGVTPHRISQALNISRGWNFYDYVNRFRVDDACRLLTSTDTNILTISEDVGFNSKSTFNAAFKKHTQLTPTKYRKFGEPQVTKS